MNKMNFKLLNRLLVIFTISNIYLDLAKDFALSIHLKKKYQSGENLYKPFLNRALV